MIITQTVPHAGDIIQVGNFNEAHLVPYLVRSMTRNHVMERINTETGEIDTVQCYFEQSKELPDLPQDDDLSAWFDVATATLSDAPASPLGNTASISYPPHDNPSINEDFQHLKYELLDTAANILRGHNDRDWRTCSCMRNLVGATASVVQSSVQGRAHIQGVQTCGSVWLCPVCSVKVSARRCEEITQILESSSSTKIQITYTLQHQLSDSLKQLRDDHRTALNYARSGSRKKRLDDRYQIEGYIRQIEDRVNPFYTGWHPHTHEILLCELAPDKIDVERLTHDLTAAYKRKLEQLGYFTNEYTVDVKILRDTEESTAGKQAAEYITKQAISMSFEMTNGQNKLSKGQSFSPFQLLDAYSQIGDERYADLFREYADATFRKNQLTFSRGLKAKYGVEEKTDEELMQDSGDVDTTICTIDRENWRKVMRLSLLASLIIEASLRPDTVIQWLSARGIEANPPEQYEYGDVSLHDHSNLGDP